MMKKSDDYKRLEQQMSGQVMSAADNDDVTHDTTPDDVTVPCDDDTVAQNGDTSMRHEDATVADSNATINFQLQNGQLLQQFDYNTTGDSNPLHEEGKPVVQGFDVMKTSRKKDSYILANTTSSKNELQNDTMGHPVDTEECSLDKEEAKEVGSDEPHLKPEEEGGDEEMSEEFEAVAEGETLVQSTSVEVEGTSIVTKTGVSQAVFDVEKAHTLDPGVNEHLAKRICPTCGKPFANRNRLMCHLIYTKCGNARETDPNFPADLAQKVELGVNFQEMKCPYCLREFRRLRDARIHYALRLCKLPGEEAMLEKIGDSFKCRFCDFVAKKPIRVFGHESREHPHMVLRSHQCPKCPRRYSAKALLQSHISTCHSDDQVLVMCDHCQGNIRKRYLNEHMRVVHNISLTQASLPVTYKDPVKCPQCSYTTHKEKNLIHHVTRAHGPREFKCGSCGSSFALKMDLLQHIKIIHGEQTGDRENVLCPHCSKILKKKNLPAHIKYVHEKARDAICQICLKSFVNKFTLRVHMETHKRPAERTYKFRCHCGSQFNNKTAFSDHQNTHTLQRPHSCNICGKSFRQVSVLHKHRELHGGKLYRCKDCKMSFSTARQLQFHKYQSHSPIRPVLGHSCLCGSHFKEQKRLRHHQDNCAVWLNLGNDEAPLVPQQTSKQVTTSSEQSGDPAEDGPVLIYQEENQEGAMVYFIKSEDHSQASQDGAGVQHAVIVMQDGGDAEMQQTANPLDVSGGRGITQPIGDDHYATVPMEAATNNKMEPSSSGADIAVSLPNLMETQATAFEQQLLQDGDQVSRTAEGANSQGGEMVQGEEVEEGAQYQCGCCFEIFNDLEKVQQHMLSVHSDGGEEGENVQIEVHLSDQ